MLTLTPVPGRAVPIIPQGAAMAPGDSRPRPAADRVACGAKVPATLALATALAAFAMVAAGKAAHANLVSHFTGTCAVNEPGYPPQGLCTGTATGVLTLADTYVPGADITAADFVSFSYTSSALDFTISPADGELVFLGGITATGDINATGELRFMDVANFAPLFQAVASPQEFSAVPPGCYTGAPPLCSDGGFSFAFGPLLDAAEPVPLALLAMGLAGISLSMRPRHRAAS